MKVKKLVFVIGLIGYLICEIFLVIRYVDLEVFVYVFEYIVWEGFDIYGGGVGGCVKWFEVFIGFSFCVLVG